MSRDETGAKPGLTIVHTTDWHLGKTLHERSREPEMTRFLDWLYERLQEERADALLVAGDVFDNPNPPHWALRLFYGFLARVLGGRGRGELACRHVVVTAGNHDSGTLLDAMAGLLGPLGVQMRGAPSAAAAGDLLTLRDDAGNPELLVAAAPFLREGDLGAPASNAGAGETIGEREARLAAAIAERYQALAAAARELNATFPAPVPVVAMGHLFAAELTDDAEGEGERPLYVGSLGRVDVNALAPGDFAYFALGHIHRPMQAGGRENARYSGSPLAMDFGEAGQAKQIVGFHTGENRARAIPVPTWQRMEEFRGDWAALQRRLEELKTESAALPDGQEIWASLVCEGEDVPHDLAEQVAAAVAGSRVAVLRLRNLGGGRRLEDARDAVEGLRGFSPREVFMRLLSHKNAAPEKQEEYLRMFDEATRALEDETQDLEGNHAHP